MTHFDYITKHLLPAWVQSWTHNFRIWADLMTDNYEGYALLKEDDPYEECYGWFWTSIGLDDTYSKEFLESLRQMVEDIDSGVVKTYPADGVLKLMEELVDDVEDGE